jgi:hypothetical protein
MNHFFRKNNILFLLLGLSLLVNSTYAAEQTIILKPFTLAKVYKNKKLPEVASITRKQLLDAGFEIVGTYEPYVSTKIFVVTDKSLLNTAAKTEFGGFGATIRVSVTEKNNEIQVVHNNPTYMGIAYNMKDSLGSTRRHLASTLGYVKDFGGEGIASDKLGDYNYAFGLEGFTGFMDLAEHKSHAEALKFVEAGFRKNLKNMKKVYRVDIPGKEQSVFGISLTNDIKDQKFLNDQFVMDIIDDKDIRRSAHLPYELMVVGKRVIIMHPHFRLAVNFPDLRMFGQHSFGKLMDLPYVYEEFFIQLAGGVWPIPDNY